MSFLRGIDFPRPGTGRRAAQIQVYSTELNRNVSQAAVETAATRKLQAEARAHWPRIVVRKTEGKHYVPKYITWIEGKPGWLFSGHTLKYVRRMMLRSANGMGQNVWEKLPPDATFARPSGQKARGRRNNHKVEDQKDYLLRFIASFKGRWGRPPKIDATFWAVMSPMFRSCGIKKADAVAAPLFWAGEALNCASNATINTAWKKAVQAGRIT